MSNEGGSSADRDLLARLNALKKTHIDLDDKQYQIPVTAHVHLPVDPAPARALYSDLAARFKSLNGTGSQNRNLPGAEGQKVDPLVEEDSKTIEELLAELGGEGAWNVEKDEAVQINDLLRSANAALKDVRPSEEVGQNDDTISGNNLRHDLPSLDVEISKPETDPEDNIQSDDEDPQKSKQELEADISREADNMIAKLRDQVKNAPPNPDTDEEEEDTGQSNETNTNLPAAPAFDLPSTPSKDPEQAQEQDSIPDNDLASRFASLSLPSAPSNTLPSAPSTKPGATIKFGTSSRYEGHTEEDIDSWCIICLEDASLRCMGCDGDLYCAKCWIEGHRGPDAGYEERRHKAIEYNKGVKKERRRRVAA